MVNTSKELFEKSAKSISSSSVPLQLTGRITKIPIIPANKNIFKLQNQMKKHEVRNYTRQNQMQMPKNNNNSKLRVNYAEQR